MGRLGPVGDSAAMAQNILATLAEDRAALSNRAIAEAAKFDWEQVMGTLFDDFYPRALEKRA